MDFTVTVGLTPPAGTEAAFSRAALAAGDALRAAALVPPRMMVVSRLTAVTFVLLGLLVGLPAGCTEGLEFGCADG